MVYSAIDLIHHDPELWEKPNDFYPEHFMKKDRTLDSKREGFIPFSVGEKFFYHNIYFTSFFQILGTTEFRNYFSTILIKFQSI